jgi:hypothetical protein
MYCPRAIRDFWSERQLSYSMSVKKAEHAWLLRYCLLKPELMQCLPDIFNYGR